MTTTKQPRPLNPRSPDTKYTGSEPEWRVQPTAETRSVRIGSAFTWYNYHYGKKEVKEFLVEWLNRGDRSSEAKELAKVPDSALVNAYGWLARMNLMGLELTESERVRLDTQISAHIHAHSSVKQIIEQPEDPVMPKITIQDRLREKMMEAAGEIEGMYDEMILAGAKMSADYKPISVLRGLNVSPQMIADIINVWRSRLDELEEAVQGRDPQLQEGYGQFGKLQLRNLVKFAEQVLADCGSYVQIKKVERKPRKKKTVSPEKLSARFRYLKEFSELNLKSVAVTDLVNAQEAWLYECKKRKLIHVVADSHVGTFTVKNNMLIGYSEIDTQQKTLRKPADVLRQIISASKPNARKIFKDLKTTQTGFNGRGTENLVILRTW
jgi:hypothetical protein